MLTIDVGSEDFQFVSVGQVTATCFKSVVCDAVGHEHELRGVWHLLQSLVMLGRLDITAEVRSTADHLSSSLLPRPPITCL